MGLLGADCSSRVLQTALGAGIGVTYGVTHRGRGAQGEPQNLYTLKPPAFPTAQSRNRALSLAMRFQMSSGAHETDNLQQMVIQIADSAVVPEPSAAKLADGDMAADPDHGQGPPAAAGGAAARQAKPRHQHAYAGAVVRYAVASAREGQRYMAACDAAVTMHSACRTRANRPGGKPG
jgi:hypothetical protein